MKVFQRSIHRIFQSLVVLALLPGSPLNPMPAQAQDPYPLRLGGAPPVNIAIGDAMDLLEGHVFVARLSAPEPGRDGGVKLRIHAYTPSGWVWTCSFDPGGQYGAKGESRIHWSSTLGDPRLGLHIPVIAHVARPDTLPTFAAFHHDAVAGLTVLFMRDVTGAWYPRETGHLQERLPASAYTLCPDFPTADTLGLEINEAQTARAYPELVAQDPGQRVLRPDLITFNPIKVMQ